MSNDYQWLADTQNIMNNAEVPKGYRMIYDPMSGEMIEAWVEIDIITGLKAKVHQND